MLDKGRVGIAVEELRYREGVDVCVAGEAHGEPVRFVVSCSLVPAEDDVVADELRTPSETVLTRSFAAGSSLKISVSRSYLIA